ncbi:hypothetical protein ACTG9Q_15950 [Actinokineospora sp. 24-640]
MTEWIGDHLGAAGIWVLIGGYLLSLWRRRNRISYGVHVDTALLRSTPNRTSGLAGMMLGEQAETVPDPCLALVWITNSGSTTIRAAVFERVPLALYFDDRTVIDAKIINGTEALRASVTDDAKWPACGTSELLLPAAPLARGDRIELLVLLSGNPAVAGTPTAVICDGGIPHGKIVRETGRGERPNWHSRYSATPS